MNEQNLKKFIKSLIKEVSDEIPKHYSGIARDTMGRVNLDDINYEIKESKGKINKIIAISKGKSSEVYTKLADRLIRLKALEDEIEKINEEVKQEGAREKIAALFGAEFEFVTRVVRTVNNLEILLTAQPKEANTVKWAEVYKELATQLTPELIVVANSIVEKYTTTQNPKPPSLKMAAKDLSESVFDLYKSFIEKLKTWGKSFDRKLDAIENDIKDIGEYSHSPEMRIGSDEPAPFGYGDINETIGQLKHSLGEMFGKLNEDGMFSKFNAISLDQFIDQQGLDEADMLGAGTSDIPSDELQGYLDRSAGKEDMYKKTGLPKLDKKGNQKYKTTKNATDKFKYPYVHPKLAREIQIVDSSGRRFDLDKLKTYITTRPNTILKQNEKITHSGGAMSQFYNIGLPALQGLGYDEKNQKFVVINTCPGAGACKVYCYAKKGGYVQYKPVNTSQTRQLNYLLNDPAGYKNLLVGEIRNALAENSKKGVKTVIRWHDSGDFFSPDYVDLAYSVAKDFPDVDFYAYTKMAAVAQGKKPDNFKMNFSAGAKPEQEKQVNFQTTKHSTVVPKLMFIDLVKRIEIDDTDKTGKTGKKIKKIKKMQFKSPESIDTLKMKLADKYKMPKDSVITYDEMMKIPVGTEPKWNVIVKPGDGDDSANRADVIGTWLLMH